MTEHTVVPALSISSLVIEYDGGVKAVRGVDLVVPPGRCVAVVGESGSGKSTLGLGVLGLLPQGARTDGSIKVGGHEIIGAGEKLMRHLRGRVVSLVAQDPMQSFDPLMTVGSSVAEAWRVHRQRPDSGTVVRALSELDIENAHVRASSRPHQWSGGMLQRAAIAGARALRPPLIVADEPTSALDADRAESILRSLRATGASILLISHDLALVGKFSDNIAVMYAGRIIEEGLSERVLEAARHPYTRALLAATPRAGHGLPVPLRGSPPRMDELLPGCSFVERCPRAQDTCGIELPVLSDGVACPVVQS